MWCSSCDTFAGGGTRHQQVAAGGDRGGRDDNGNADIDFINQVLPDTERPNNVLAPFWTDLNPEDGGDMLVNVLCAPSGDCWLVLEWTDVPEFSSLGGLTHTMQIWLGLEEDLPGI